MNNAIETNISPVFYNQYCDFIKNPIQLVQDNYSQICSTQCKINLSSKLSFGNPGIITFTPTRLSRYFPPEIFIYNQLTIAQTAIVLAHELAHYLDILLGKYHVRNYTYYEFNELPFEKDDYQHDGVWKQHYTRLSENLKYTLYDDEIGYNYYINHNKQFSIE